MKNIHLVAAGMMLILIGCSDQNSLVGPVQDPGASAVSTTAACMPGLVRNMVCIGSDDPMTSIVSASQRVTVKSGGSVRLAGSFKGSYGDSVYYDISISFIPGALPRDTTITISIDKSSYQEDGTVTFGPCGIAFITPGTLSMRADNIQIAKNATSLRLYYLVNGTMQVMPSSWGSMVTKRNWDVVAGAKIPHFSRYAFGR